MEFALPVARRMGIRGRERWFRRTLVKGPNLTVHYRHAPLPLMFILSMIK